MTTREFDPVFSAALRNELEVLADQDTRPARGPLHRTLRAPQVWVTVATAIVLIAATLGVLRLTHTDVQPATPTPEVADPLSSITNPSYPGYVARRVTVLLDAHGTGSGTRPLTVPAGTRGIQVYFACSRSAKWSVGLDDGGLSSSDGCDRGPGSSFATAVKAGLHTARVHVPAGVHWALLVIERPAPTVSSGLVIDPLTAVNDLSNPDAVVGDTRPLALDAGLTGDVTYGVNLPANVGRLRLYVTCAARMTSSSTATSTPSFSGQFDGHAIRGCQNSIAHWFDFTPSGGDVESHLVVPDGFTATLLLIRAPKGAKDSPANATLPYPEVGSPVIAQARGAGAEVTGTYLQPHDAVGITTTCRGTGWLEIQAGDSGTSTRGTACSTTTPNSTGFSGSDDAGKRHRFTVIPHGDISWTLQLTDDR